MLRAVRLQSVVVLAFCALACASGCSSSSDAADGAPGPTANGSLLAYPVDQVGPFVVGYRTWPLTYTTPFGEQRTVAMHVWYPASAKTDTTPVYRTIFADKDVFVDAPLAPPVEAAGYPVHVYSHGNPGFGGASADLMHYFASHGWVAVAPDHTGNIFPDNPPALPPPVYYLRSADISAVLTALETLPPSDPLSGKCRTKEVFMSGHSFGTFTTWATMGAAFDVDEVKKRCADGKTFSQPCTDAEIALFAKGFGDPRIAAGLPMAGGVGATETGWFGQKGYDAVGKPMMLLSGTEDLVGADNVFARASGNITWIEIAGACHQAFAIGGCKSLEENEGFHIIDTYALALARKVVLHDSQSTTGAILDGVAVVSSKAAYHHKP